MTPRAMRLSPLRLCALLAASVALVPAALPGQCRNDDRNGQLIETALVGRAAMTGDSHLQIDSASASRVICEPAALVRLVDRLVSNKALLGVAPPNEVRDTLRASESPLARWTVVGLACADVRECLLEAVVDAPNGGAVEGYSLVFKERWRLARLTVSQLYYY